ncbi:hypothetical protein QE152_g25515 [Popillia japonica]|uniref:Uncharacterized protein n=1 Tax=Popillia japonica TaxID=7064 RepID=A0AAW1K1S1_POPJA
MSNSNEVLYKCSYCQWTFNSFCINYEEHECFKDFNNETEVIIADENNFLTIVARDDTNETQESDLIWAPNTKLSIQDNEATEMLIA